MATVRFSTFSLKPLPAPAAREAASASLAVAYSIGTTNASAGTQPSVPLEDTFTQLGVRSPPFTPTYSRMAAVAGIRTMLPSASTLTACPAFSVPIGRDVALARSCMTASAAPTCIVRCTVRSGWASTRAAFMLMVRGSVATTYLSDDHDLAVRLAASSAFTPAHPTANVPRAREAALAARRVIHPDLLIYVSSEFRISGRVNDDEDG